MLTLALLTALIAPQAHAQSTSSREYQIKAAFLYNFIKFVDWPKEKTADANAPMSIGILGKDPFQDAFEPLQEREGKDKKVAIRRFEGFVELEKSGQKKKDQPHPRIQEIQKCHLLFICPSETERIGDILACVKGHSVLTVADATRFLEAGGVINFVTEEKKIRFEVNAAAAKQAKLSVRSQLLRLAKRIIKEDGSEGNK